MGLRVAASAAALMVVVVSSRVAEATILTFDISDTRLDPSVYGADGFPEGYGVIGLPGVFVPPNLPDNFYTPLTGYGNNVTGATGTNVNGFTQFSYGVDTEGYTPNVTVSYDPAGLISGGPALWRDGYGDLSKVVYQSGNWSTLDINLQAAAGYNVALYGFDLGAYLGDIVIAGVEVFDGIPFPFVTPTNQIFSEYNVTIPGINDHASYDFTAPLISNHIVIRISTTGPLGEDQHDLIGIDNIRFGQQIDLTPVPEPASATLLGLGLGALGLDKARRRRIRTCEAA